MSRQSKYCQLHLHRGKSTREPESLSDAGSTGRALSLFSDEGSAGREGRAYVTRVDTHAKVAYAAATPAVRAHASTVKRMP
jgi:hypothetical protein